MIPSRIETKVSVMKSWINLVLVSGLSLLAFGSSLIACLNDSELVSREREFRATYLHDSAGSESTSADSRNALPDSWYTGPTEAELRRRLNLWWWFGAGLCVTAFLISMSAAARSQHRLKFVLWLPLQLIGIGISMLLGMAWSLFCYPPLPVPSAAPFLAETYRLPHHIPYQQGGISIRFQMIHDVLRERFLNHSPAWYEARNQSLRKQLRKLSTNNPKSWPLIDDLAVGMDRLGKPEAAIPMLREKLAQQQAQQIPLSGKYTSLANLGTLLIHSGLMNQRLPENSLESLRQLKEGIELIREAVEANPEAHFGREQWQLRIAEFLCRAASEPELLKETDCLGN